MTMLGPNPMKGREEEYTGRKGGSSYGGGSTGATGYRSNQANSSFTSDDDDYESDDQF
jgi:hypothetical protein